MQWAVSQAVYFRRMHVRGSMVLHQQHGWASGGWMADTRVDGDVDSGSQQQWISRNSEWKSWTGANWNMVFVGVDHPPVGNWPKPPYTKVAMAPVTREKPFLEINREGGYSVFVPPLQHDTSGVSWQAPGTRGRLIPLRRFYIAQPDRDTAATINRALASGKHLLLTPGIYDLEAPLRVERPDTIVLGLGFATLHPTHGTAAMTVGDADGISIAGLLFDAGENRSPVLLQIGATQTKVRHAANPITLSDVFFRVGGAGVGKVVSNLIVNANDTLIDHTWIWRADHGQGVGWTSNQSDTGVTINGDDVTAYGLFVEHHQHFQVLWNGERGRTYFFQSEIPYDPPDQASWRSQAGLNGWAAYKVVDHVVQHEAWGLGAYSVFRHPEVSLSHAIEAPTTPGVRFHHMITVALDNLGQITHIINDAGDAATTAQPRKDPKLAEYPAETVRQ